MFKYLLALLFVPAAHAADVKLLTDRSVEYFTPVAEAFKAKTGKTVEIVAGSYSELQGQLDGADLLLVKDISSIVDADVKGFFQPLSEANRNAGVPAFMRGENWTAVSYRIRTIAIDPTVLSAKDVPTYESLTDSSLKRGLCIRDTKSYMKPLVAWMVARYGEAKTEDILKGWRSNLMTFTEGDTASLNLIATGACKATITNHYYLARLRAKDSRFPAELVFADQFEGGVHTNGGGGGVLKNAPNAQVAQEFISFLLSAEGGEILVKNPSFEYPAAPGLKPESIVSGFGQFRPSEVPWTEVYANLGKASEILDRVGWAN